MANENLPEFSDLVQVATSSIKHKDGIIDAYIKLYDAKHAENLELYKFMQLVMPHLKDLPTSIHEDFIELVGSIQAKAAVAAIANNVLLEVLKAALENEKRADRILGAK